MRERLKGEVAEEIVEYLYKPAIMADGQDIFDIMLDADVAHVLMLGKQGILDTPVLKETLQGLADIRTAGFLNLPVDSTMEDLHYNIEKNLIDRTSMDVGGRMHTARSRNDLACTTTRMLLRAKILTTLALLCTFRRAVLALGRKHAGTVMTVYTHMQPAQPITFGYYLAGFAAALERDFHRLAAAYANNNRNPMGGGAIAGTSFPVDREYTAALLGFDGYIPNAMDAIASKDHILDALCALNTLMLGISRVAQDFYIWATDEFNLLSVENSIAASSSIMPQKKNPVTLEHIKAKASHTLAALTSASATLKNTPFSHTREVSRETTHLVTDAFTETFVALKLFIATLKYIRVNKDVMLEKTRANFSTATELADVLVQEYGIPFRQAHHIVGSLVSGLAEKRLCAEDITPEMLIEASGAVTGSSLHLQGARLKKILDPTSNVERRTGDGNTAPAEVLNSIEKLEHKLDADAATIERFNAHLLAAQNHMRLEAEKILTTD